MKGEGSPARREVADPHGVDARLAALHVAGAGARAEEHRPSDRHLVARSRPLRDAVREGAARRYGDDRRADRQHLSQAAAARAGARSVGPAGGRRDRAPRPRARPGLPLRVGRAHVRRDPDPTPARALARRSDVRSAHSTGAHARGIADRARRVDAAVDPAGRLELEPRRSTSPPARTGGEGFISPTGQRTSTNAGLAGTDHGTQVAPRRSSPAWILWPMAAALLAGVGAVATVAVQHSGRTGRRRRPCRESERRARRCKPRSRRPSADDAARSPGTPRSSRPRRWRLPQPRSSRSIPPPATPHGGGATAPASGHHPPVFRRARARREVTPSPECHGRRGRLYGLGGTAARLR